MTRMNALQDENEKLRRRITELEASLARNNNERELTEKILTQSSARFHSLFETMAQGVVYQDASGMIMLVNPAAVRILGISQDEMQRRKLVAPHWRAVREDGSELPADEHPAMVALRTGKPVNDVVMGVFNPDEMEYRWILANAIPEFHVDETQPYRVFTTFTDITVQKQAEQKMRANEQALKLFVEYAPAAIAMFDSGMRYIAASRRYISDYQLTEQDLTGRSHYEVFPEMPERWKEIHRKCLAGAIEKAEADPFPRADGGLDWVHWEIHPWYEAEGKIGGIILFSEVITESKQAVAELRESEERFSTAFFTSPVSQSIITQGNNEIMAVNDACCRLFKYSREELIGTGTAKLNLWENPADRLAAVEELQKTGHLLPREATVRDGTGERLTVIAAIEPITWKGIPCFISSIFDITERKRAEAAVAEREQKLNKLLEILPVGVSILDDAGQVVFGNHALAQILQIDPAGLASGDYRNRRYLAADGAPLLPEQFASRQTVKTGQAVHNVETGVVKEDGETIWTSVSAVPVNFSDWKTVIVTANVTERKKMEAALRESEELFHAAIEFLPIPLAVADQKGNIIHMNQRFFELYGYTVQDLPTIDDWMLKAYPDLDYRKEVVANWNQRISDSLKKNIPTPLREFKVTCKDGSQRIVEIVARGIKGLILASFNDITDRKQADKELVESEARYRLIAGNTADVIWVMDPFTRKFTYVSPSVMKLRGYTPEEVMAQPVSEALTPESLGMVSASLAENLPPFIARGSGTESYINEVDQPCKDGSIVHTEATTTYLFNEHGQVEIVGVSRDITERKKIEAELRRSNADLEQFAYVVSHDLQEPLRTMSGMAQMLQRKYQGRLDERADEYIDLTVEAASRMQALIRDLLAYSRVDRRGKALEPVDLQLPLDMALSNLQVAIEETGAEITYAELPTVLADTSQLAQVFQNLIGNALKFRGEQRPKIQINVMKSIDAYQFTVCDNGIGIEPQYFERIFQVFQRLHTIREYPGTGIGLALCKKIVERHGGKIWLESQPGEGSKFHFTLPISDLPQ